MIEILQDDQVRDHLNPSEKYPDHAEHANNPYSNGNANYEDNLDQCDDEEEMLEMMAMQEECRLEMMKFYIQSQNPKLFEDIYHDVSYPDSVKPSEQLDPIRPQQQQGSRQAQNQETTETEQAQEDAEESGSLKDSIINGLNSSANEFVPNKFADLSLNDSTDNNKN